MWRKLTIVALLAVGCFGSVNADKEARKDRRIAQAIERAYGQLNPARVIAEDPKDKKMVVLTRASSAWVTVYERCKSTDDELLKVSYALSILIKDWGEAQDDPESWTGRPANKIYRDLKLLTKYAEKLRAKEGGKESANKQPRK